MKMKRLVCFLEVLRASVTIVKKLVTRRQNVCNLMVEKVEEMEMAMVVAEAEEEIKEKKQEPATTASRRATSPPTAQS